MSDQTGTSIRELRRNLRMTQEEFAHTLGITVATVNRWENGHAKPSKLARRAIERLVQYRQAAATTSANA
jgi:DNA-binding transcriptional regulator YiaG